MEEPCKEIKYKKKRSNKPIVKPNGKSPALPMSSEQTLIPRQIYLWKGECEEDLISFPPQRNTVQDLREWVVRQRFIPQDLSDDFLMVFLSGVGFDLKTATEKLEKYFYSRQEPSPLFRDRDPLSPENVKLFEKLYVVPVPDATEKGEKIILAGTRKTICGIRSDRSRQGSRYGTRPIDLGEKLNDLCTFEKDFGFGEFIVVLDGRGFECPQLLERKVNDHRSITSLLLDTIPGSLRSFYLLYPPPHVMNVADNRNGLWLTVVKRKEDMVGYLPKNMLPFEFGGNLGHLDDLLVQWHQHLAQSRDFFIEFEKRMLSDYRRRTCHEKEVEEGGKAWVYRMKIEADEWQYKTEYYERMKKMTSREHIGFGKDRVIKQKNEKKLRDNVGYFVECKRLAKLEKEANLLFEPTYLYHGYAPEIRKQNQMRQQRESPNASLLRQIPIFCSFEI
ncbi:hypothetical protein RUM44_012747 [Polyplax serrata]|uniref:CRAL-TRIO domain-containing protein n=1 Tax=Polyplax serrata TaxID=468196 RepID=A0ABR1BH24_POLSC